MKKVIITGANGFIGSALCRRLTSEGIEVIAVVRNKESNIVNIEKLPHLRIVCCDLSDYHLLPELIPDRDADCLYHFAWHGTSGDLRSKYDVQLENIRCTCVLIESCSIMTCNRFVFASSIMEYEIIALMKSEISPSSSTMYSCAKLAADYMARIAATANNIEYLRAVISNVYGPGEHGPRLINSSLRKLLNGEHCSFSPGEQLYDFIYIDDAVSAFHLMGEKGIKNRTYYIGSLTPHPLKEFLIEMGKQVSSDIDLGIGELPFNGISLTYKEFDVMSLYNDTGFIPRVSFSDGIQKTIEWLKKEIN